jgi:5-methylthioadenosine/S-adenosylhomocysteine deaminase
MTLFRGYGGDLALMEWLEQKIWPAEARLTDDDVYWGTRLACIEMIRTGTVRFWDMYWRPTAVARAVSDAGLRATLGPPLLDGMDADRSKAAATGRPALGARRRPDVEASLAPRRIYGRSGRRGRRASSARGLPVQLHFPRPPTGSGCVDRHETPAFLDRLGLLSPSRAAHGVWMEAGAQLVAGAAPRS